MKKFIQKFPFTSVAITSSLVLVACTLTFNLELWENLTKLVAMGESWEADEIIIPIFLLMMGISADALLTVLDAKRVTETVNLYNQMNEEVLNEISTHLTKLLAFRTSLMKDAPDALDARHELDRMIIKSFNHYERSQRRSNIDSHMIELAISNPKTSTKPAPLA